MRSLSLVAICSLLLAATACSSEPSDPGGGEIRSEADVQRLFEAIVPDLVEAFTELANNQSFATSALSSSRDKSAHISSVPCPGGGTLDVDLTTMQATLTNCSVGGVTISATLTLFVFPLGPSSYGANFMGILMVSGSFTGTVDVNNALIEWTVPPTVATTFWDVTVIVNGQMFTVSSGDSGNGMLECNEPDPVEGPGSVPRNGPCDEDSDCQSDSCRDPITNPSEGCTCGGGDSNCPEPPGCDQCIGANAAPLNLPQNLAMCCTDVDGFTCSCLTDSGDLFNFILSGVGCFFEGSSAN